MAMMFFLLDRVKHSRAHSKERVVHKRGQEHNQFSGSQAASAAALSNDKKWLRTATPACSRQGSRRPEGN
jgi:hypothetical protein